MTIETITAQLDRISAGSSYDVNGNYIDLTINDLECFIDKDAVDTVLIWLEENADYACGTFYRSYHFGDIVVEVGYTSFDI